MGVTSNAITTKQPTNDGAKNWATAGILISWATFWLFLLSPIGFLAWIGILGYLLFKKSKLRWYVFLSAWLVVPSCNFLTGTARYFTGTASLQGVGGPQTFHGIDRETRVVSTSSGCIFLGFEPFVFPANNAAVRLWTNLFGFQRGSYKGVFPTEEEAQEIMKSADTIFVNHSENFLQFNLAGQNVKIDTSFTCIWILQIQSTQLFARLLKTNALFSNPLPIQMQKKETLFTLWTSSKARC